MRGRNVFRVLRVSRKTFFNPTEWLGWENLKTMNAALFAMVRPLFSASQPQIEETFEEAKDRLGLTEEDIRITSSQYRTYAIIFLLIGLLLFTYSFYILFAYAKIGGFCLGLGVTALSCIQAYKYDFWVFQMRRRKLGATFSEWLNYILGNKGSSV